MLYRQGNFQRQTRKTEVIRRQRFYKSNKRKMTELLTKTNRDMIILDLYVGIYDVMSIYRGGYKISGSV